MALSLALGTHTADCFSRWMYSDLSAVEHLDAGDVERVSRTSPHRFREAGDADSHQLALFPFLFLLFPQLGVTDHFQRFVQRPFVVPAVVRPAQWSFVGELGRLNEISAPQFGLINLQLTGKDVHHSLDQISGLGDPKRTAVGNSSWRFVGIHTVHFAE